MWTLQVFNHLNLSYGIQWNWLWIIVADLSHLFCKFRQFLDNFQNQKWLQNNEIDDFSFRVFCCCQLHCKQVCASDEHEWETNKNRRKWMNKIKHVETPSWIFLSPRLCFCFVCFAKDRFRSYAVCMSCKHVRRKWITESDHFWTASSKHCNTFKTE